MSNTDSFDREDTARSSREMQSSESERADLRAELELLRERNRQLQNSYVNAKRTQYERSALGLAVIGGLAIIGGVILPDVRSVLFALGAIGLFGGVLTYYLTPERFVSADVGAAVYDAVTDDRTAIVAELGLADARVYVPVGDAMTRVRLFIPQRDDYELPPPETLEHTHVVPDTAAARGISFRPSGEILFQSFEEAVSGGLAETPEGLASQLTDALVEQFGLVEQARFSVDPTENRLTVGVSDSVYGSVDRIDHPVVSVLAVGLARGLGQHVTVDTRGADDDRVDYQITCRWDTNTASDA